MNWEWDVERVVKQNAQCTGKYCEKRLRNGNRNTGTHMVIEYCCCYYYYYYYHHHHYHYPFFLMIMLLGFSKNSKASHPTRQRRHHLYYFLFMFIQVWNDARLFWIPLVFFLVISGALHFFLVTCETFASARCVSAASFVCKEVNIIRKPFTSFNRFCAYIWHSVLNLSACFKF